MSEVTALYHVHHSHTDLGFTHDPAIVWDLQERFIDKAVELAERYAASSTDGAFRWTVETTGVLIRWLEHARSKDIDRFKALEKAGRIEVTAMLANITPLFDLDQFIESLQPLARLRSDYGFTIRHAMNCDVNGHNWPIVDALLDAGIRSFSMAINTHFGGIPFPRPTPFWWQGPTGRRILAYNGFPYSQGLLMGIGRDAAEFENAWWPRLQRQMDEVDYPLSSVLVQSYHPYGDNGSAYEGYCGFIDTWNKEGHRPRIIFSTPSQWVDAILSDAAALPAWKGDWTDYWNFGAGSSANESRINRSSRDRLRDADALAAAAYNQGGSGGRCERSMSRHRAYAWHNLYFWDEHTWGADVAMTNPGSDDTATQWNFKANLAYTAHSLSKMLRRDALAEVALRVQRRNANDILVYNPTPWTRKISGLISRYTIAPRGTPDDTTSARHMQDRDLEFRRLSTKELPIPYEEEGRFLAPTDVPGYGYIVVEQKQLIEPKGSVETSQDATVENHRHRLAFDTERGGVRSWFDNMVGREWVQPDAGYIFGGFLHEEVADHESEWPRRLLYSHQWDAAAIEIPTGWSKSWKANRRQATRVRNHRVYRTPIGTSVVQDLEPPPGTCKNLRQTVFLPADGGYIEFESSWEMGDSTHPEATYVVFPLNLGGQTRVRLDVGGMGIEPEQQQLPGVCRDYFTAQRWVDFCDGDQGVVIATPDVPMVQFGGFHFAEHQSTFKLDRPMFLGWVTNNYWETNFRAHQPGRVSVRYRLLPYAGDYAESRSHRFGLESRYDRPLVQHLGEAPVSQALPGRGSLLGLPDSGDAPSAIITLHVKPAKSGPAVLVRLLNTSDDPQEATVRSGLVQIRSASRCDFFGNPKEKLEVRDGEARCRISPRSVCTLQIE